MTSSIYTDGVLLINKPTGRTSFSIVKSVKKVLKGRKVGHLGTLDPLATGLLPLTIGEATKLSKWLGSGLKRYRALIRLGLSTDTLDREGEINGKCAIPPLTAKKINESFRTFIGTIDQLPPLYSAIHHEGRRLYELARIGVNVKRQPRKVEIKTIDLVEFGNDFIEIDLVCGPGTYVRSLAVDIAKQLGTLGHIEQLCRTENAQWKLSQAHPIEKINETKLKQWMIPIEKVLDRFTRIDVSEPLLRKLAQGQEIQVNKEELPSSFSMDRPDDVVWLRAYPFPPLILARPFLSSENTIRLKPLRVLRPLSFS